MCSSKGKLAEARLLTKHSSCPFRAQYCWAAARALGFQKASSSSLGPTARQQHQEGMGCVCVCVFVRPCTEEDEQWMENCVDAILPSRAKVCAYVHLLLCCLKEKEEESCSSFKRKGKRVVSDSRRGGGGGGVVESYFKLLGEALVTPVHC